MRRWAAITAAVVVCAAAAAIAIQQRGVAAQWRTRASTEHRLRTSTQTDLARTKQQVGDLETRLSAVAHDAAVRGDDKTIAAFERDLADRAAKELGACSDRSSSECRTAIIDALDALATIASPPSS